MVLEVPATKMTMVRIQLFGAGAPPQSTSSTMHSVRDSLRTCFPSIVVLLHLPT